MLTVEETYEDHIVCSDLLREEEVVLPRPDIPGALEKNILFGHICDEGMMMLNYITAVPASRPLQRRIKDTIQQEYELFLYQSPKADMDDFLAREAALVRHTIHMLASRARLNVRNGRSRSIGVRRSSVHSLSYRRHWDSATMRGICSGRCSLTTRSLI